jgi:hypothetical protein
VLRVGMAVSGDSEGAEPERRDSQRRLGCSMWAPAPASRNVTWRGRRMVWRRTFERVTRGAAGPGRFDRPDPRDDELHRVLASDELLHAKSPQLATRQRVADPAHAQLDTFRRSSVLPPATSRLSDVPGGPRVRNRNRFDRPRALSNRPEDLADEAHLFFDWASANYRVTRRGVNACRGPRAGLSRLARERSEPGARRRT